MSPLDRRPLLRVAALFALCAACLQAGRLLERLEAASRVPPAPRAAAAPAAAPEPDPVLAGPAHDLITPLNARDPSALVMPPYDPPPASAFVAPPPPPVPASSSNWR